MAKSLKHKDDRKQAYKEIGDSRFNTEPKDFTTPLTIQRDDGEYIYNSMAVELIMKKLANHDRAIRELKQMDNSLAGQLEYIYKNGIDEYITLIDDIRNQYPKPE